MADTIRTILAFQQKHRTRTENLFNVKNIVYPSTIFVGVHVRRGDYRTWENGIYCWPDEVYRVAMYSFAKKMEGRNVRFLISSDEPVQVESFTSSMYGVEILSGNSYEDMYALSRCDYVMGPRSTFSRVAAFLGNAMYHEIQGANDPCDPLSFEKNPVPR